MTRRVKYLLALAIGGGVAFFWMRSRKKSLPPQIAKDIPEVVATPRPADQPVDLGAITCADILPGRAWPPATGTDLVADNGDAFSFPKGRRISNSDRHVWIAAEQEVPVWLLGGGEYIEGTVPAFKLGQLASRAGALYKTREWIRANLPRLQQIALMPAAAIGSPDGPRESAIQDAQDEFLSIHSEDQLYDYPEWYEPLTTASPEQLLWGAPYWQSKAIADGYLLDADELDEFLCQRLEQFKVA